MCRIAPRSAESNQFSERSLQEIVRSRIAIVDARPEDGWPTERYGAEVTRCESASAALRLSRTDAPDLWVINIELGDLSGYDLCRMLKERRPKTPVFLVADDYSPTLEQAALAARATLFVCKPAHVDAIRQWITAHAMPPHAAHAQPTARTLAH